MSLAGPAGGLVASLPASAASAGIALGSTASGAAYAVAGPSAVILTGMVIALGALALAVATRRLRPPVVPTPLARSARPDAEAALAA
jgi:DHA1 family inner membrane transport protein